MDKKVKRFNPWYIVLLIFSVILFRDWFFTSTQVKTVPYSEFQTLLEQKKVNDLVVSDTTVKARLTDESGPQKFVQTNRIEQETAKEFEKYGVKYSSQTENPLLRSLFSWVIPFLVLYWLGGMILRRSMGKAGNLSEGLMSVGKNKAKIYVQSDVKITFNDVAGADEAKAELQELVEFLREPSRVQRLGGRMPKGVLLIGPPGTGKTLIAKAVAGEAGVPFFSTNGAEFVEMFVGVGAARVRDLFEQAKKQSPCIIFVDELDALGRSRISTGASHGNDEKEQTLNQLLAELDGFDSRTGVVILAATNRPEILDPALLRSGRFDRQVLVDRPDRVGRTAVLKLHAKKVMLGADVNLEKIASITPGFTGADLANLVNEAALFAARKKKELITEDDFVQAIERITAGLEKKNRLINPFEKNIVAHHEMGHAIVAAAINDNDTVHKVSIIPRGIGALGYTMQRPTEDRFLMTQDELQNKMTILLGGRAAEKIVFHHLSSGAADDLEKATDLAWNLVTRFGMSEKLGNVVYDKRTTSFIGDFSSPSRNRPYSDQTAREMDCAVRDLCQEALNSAVHILKINEDLLRSSTALLLEKETLIEDELRPIFAKVRKVLSAVPEFQAQIALAKFDS